MYMDDYFFFLIIKEQENVVEGLTIQQNFAPIYKTSLIDEKNLQRRLIL